MKHLVKRDRGASAIVIAISMLVLMGFAALVVDIGAGFNERSQDQSAADAGVLSGAVSFVAAEGAVLNAVIPSIRNNVQATLGTPLTDDDWRNCSDPAHLETTEGDLRGESPPYYECVSFGPNDDDAAYGRIRVRVPNQQVANTFGRLLGSAFLTTSGAAESQMRGTLGAGTFPSGVGSDADVGSTHCYKTGSGSKADASDCGGSSQGNFGTFLPYFYTDVPGSENSICESGQATIEMAYLYAAGLDHFLFPYPTDPTIDSTLELISGGDCKGSASPLNPNTVEFSGGNQPSDITNGIVLGGSGKYQHDGRLAVASSTATVFKTPIDNQPLWKFIDPSQLPLPTTGPKELARAACEKAASNPTFSKTPGDIVDWRADLLDCLKAWDKAFGESKYLFTPAVMNTPRLVVAPVFWETTAIIDSLPNSALLHVETFAPLYLDGLWVNKTGNTTCTGVEVGSKNDYCTHLPGMEGEVDKSGNVAISSGSAIVLSCGLLPPDTSAEPAQDRCKRVNTGSGSGSTAAVFIEIQLTR